MRNVWDYNVECCAHPALKIAVALRDSLRNDIFAQAPEFTAVEQKKLIKKNVNQKHSLAFFEKYFNDPPVSSIQS